MDTNLFFSLYSISSIRFLQKLRKYLPVGALPLKWTVELGPAGGWGGPFMAFCSLTVSDWLAPPQTGSALGLRAWRPAPSGLAQRGQPLQPSCSQLPHINIWGRSDSGMSFTLFLGLEGFHGEAFIPLVGVRTDGKSAGPKWGGLPASHCSYSHLASILNLLGSCIELCKTYSLKV